MLFSAPRKSSWIRLLMRTLFSCLSGGEGRQSERESSKTEHFLRGTSSLCEDVPNSNQPDMQWQHPNKGCPCSQQNSSASFSAFSLQMTQSPHPSPLIPPNYHFSSLSPRPKGMGCFGVARSYHEIFLCARVLLQEINSHGIRTIKLHCRRAELSIKE